MHEIADPDWEELQALAALAAVGEERVAVARLRFAAGSDRPSGPLTLLIGRPESGIDLLFDKWLGSEAATALREARGRPLVVGPRSTVVKPRQGSWPVLRCERLDGYCLVAVRAPSLAADVMAQLASLGTFEQVVLVTRWSQPLPTAERDLIRPLAELGGIARALVVTLPGEGPGPDEIAEVKQFVLHLMRDGGFDGRGAEVGVWLTAGSAPHTVERLETFLAPRHDETANGRAGAARTTFASLLREVAARGRSANLAQPLPVDPEDLQKIETDLAGYLKVLAESTQRRFAAAVDGTAEQVQAFVREQIVSWKQPISAAGMWLHYVEAVRPGATVGLMNVVAEASKSVGFEPPPAPPPGLTWRPPAMWSAKFHKVVMGLVAGAIVYGVMAWLLPKDLPGRDVLAALGMMAGAIGGFAVAPHFKEQLPVPDQRPIMAREGELTSWPAFQHALQTWIHAHVAGSAASLGDRCRRLAARLDVSLDN